MTQKPNRASLERRLGEVVKGRYRLDSILGVGGQGAVYRARDLRDDDEVAIKVLHDQADRDPTARERLTREAQALMVLRGTAAVTVLDQAFTNDGRLCLVQEMLLGEDLEDALVKMEGRGLHFRTADLPFLYEPIVTTLERAHALDIVHRDLKPENVFLETQGESMRVRMMDFGFAKFSRMTKLTMDGFVAGSPSYIAPESWLDRPVTPGVDVYAMAAMIFRTLAGRPPFATKDMMEMYKLATRAERPSLHALRPDLPRDVDDWVRQALAIDPNERFRTPRASYRALCSVLGLPVS